jgi:hypothetical protein
LSRGDAAPKEVGFNFSAVVSLPSLGGFLTGLSSRPQEAKRLRPEDLGKTFSRSSFNRKCSPRPEEAGLTFVTFLAALSLPSKAGPDFLKCSPRPEEAGLTFVTFLAAMSLLSKAIPPDFLTSQCCDSVLKTRVRLNPESLCDKLSDVAWVSSRFPDDETLKGHGQKNLLVISELLLCT